jgi:hypothetical protein
VLCDFIFLIMFTMLFYLYRVVRAKKKLCMTNMPQKEKQTNFFTYAFMHESHMCMIRLKRIYNFLCFMLVFTPFALCFVTFRGVFMRFLELTY